MSFDTNIRFVDNSINLSFLGKHFTSSEILLFIPGGPGLSSSYMKPFMEILSNSISFDMALVDLPNHNKSSVFQDMTFYEASCLIWKLVDELNQKYEKVSIFAHSLGGCLLFGSSINHKILSGQLFLSGVPFSFERSTDYLDKRKEITINDFKVINNRDFILNFNQILPLYFYDNNNYYPQQFWTEGCFWENGQKILSNIVSVSESMEPKKNWMQSLCLIDGENDLIIPEDNQLKFLTAFPFLTQSKIVASGHLISAYLLSLALGSQLLASSNSIDSVKTISESDKIKIEQTKENLLQQLRLLDEAKSFLRETPSAEKIKIQILKLDEILQDESSALGISSGVDPY